MDNSISKWLARAEKKLASVEIPSARLDAELILARVLRADRTYLHAKPDKKLTKQQIFHANNWLNQRAKRVPLAYLFREKEFYGRNFYVNGDVLVPRPETEALIDLAKGFLSEADSLLDVGVGSGIIPITLSKEIAGLRVSACDISIGALAVANINAKKILGCKIPLFRSNILADVPAEILSGVTALSANLPYVNRNWIDFSKPNELHYEPQEALYADEGGVALYRKLFTEAEILPALKMIFIEADPDQFEALETIALERGFEKVAEKDYALAFRKK